VHTLQSYLTEQRKAFAAAMRAPGDYPMAVQDAARTLRTLHISAKVEWDAAAPPQTVFIRSAGLHKECWIHIGYGDYRKAFLRFLQVHCGLPSHLVPGGYHADHVFNAALAGRLGLQYVRMALLPASINSKYGATIERNMTQQTNRKQVFLIDYFIMMKLLCIPVPATREEFVRQIPAIARAIFAAGAVESVAVAEMGLAGMLQYYAPLSK